MADTQFELGMDDFVRQNLRYRTGVVQYKDAGVWKTDYYDIVGGRQYRVGFQATNAGSETYVKNVQLRVVNNNPGGVTFYTDDTYATEASNQVNSAFQGATLGPGQSTPWFWVYLQGQATPNLSLQLSVGVYAEIVPQGHCWELFSRLPSL